jgi:hypothetical protein
VQVEGLLYTFVGLFQKDAGESTGRAAYFRVKATACHLETPANQLVGVEIVIGINTISYTLQVLNIDCPLMNEYISYTKRVGVRL